jgi:hypothetical protein
MLSKILSYPPNVNPVQKEPCSKRGMPELREQLDIHEKKGSRHVKITGREYFINLLRQKLAAAGHRETEMTCERTQP